jgi:hypothetical protein
MCQQVSCLLIAVTDFVCGKACSNVCILSHWKSCRSISVLQFILISAFSVLSPHLSILMNSVLSIGYKEKYV